jgi:multiple sugar transport system substrate-binding protein
MKIFSRLFLVAVMTVLLSLTLTVTVAQDEAVTLNLWMFLDGTGFLPSVVEAFQAQYPHITVQITDVPEDEYTTKIDTAILAGEPPDIGFPYAARWIKAGYVLPIDDAMAAQDINLDDFNSGAVSRNCTFDGRVYCLGTYTGGTVLFYNKDLFDAAEIPYPSPTEPMTIDQYAEYVTRLSVPSDNIEERVWGGAAPGPFWMEVAHYYSEDGRTAVGYVNDEATVHFYQVAADLIASGNVLTEADTSLMSLTTPLDLMATGQLAMAVGDSVIGQPLFESVGINWGAAPPPVEQAGQPGWVYTGSDELMAFSGSAHPEEAVLFVLFWGTEGNRMRLEADGLPLNMRMAEEGNWAGDSEGRQEMFAAIQTARPTVFVPEWYFVFDHLGEALNGLMVEDGMSAQEALDEIAPIVQEELDLRWETWEQIQPAQ